MTSTTFKAPRRLLKRGMSDARVAYHVVHSMTRFDARQHGVQKSSMHEWLTLPAAWRRRSPATGGGQLMVRAERDPRAPAVIALRVLAGSGDGLWTDELDMKRELAARKALGAYMRAFAAIERTAA